MKINIFQINSRVLHKRQKMYLDKISTDYWQSIKDQGYGAVWLMGVWTICEYSVVESQKNFGSFPLESIVGSCFAIDDYRPDTFMGDLNLLKANLNAIGLKLILDFVPNHFGRMGSFFVNNPELFLVSNHQFSTDNNFEFQNQFYNQGKEPNYNSWTDAAQLDYSSPKAINKMRDVLVEISRLCDGLRCDMSMLLLPEIFEKTWGKTSLDFWHGAIQGVKAINPNFVFVAEVYWDLEMEMIEHGFDLVYNKKFLDGLLQNDIDKLNYAMQMIRTGKSLIFLENHDEPRIASLVNDQKLDYFNNLMFALDSSILIQDGQLEGQKERIPIQVCL